MNDKTNSGPGNNEKIIAIESKFKNILTNENEIIAKTIFSALKSPWYESLSEVSKNGLLLLARQFLNWLITVNSKKLNYSKIVNKYHNYKINECGVKPQSTNANNVLKLLIKGSLFIERKEFTLVEDIIRTTKTPSKFERTPLTMTRYFNEILWLSSYMKENEYRQIDSPKILINSLSTAIATLLHSIIEQKQTLPKELFKELNINISPRHRIRKQRIDHARNLFTKYYFNNGVIKSSLFSEILLADCVKEKHEQRYIETLNAHPNKLPPIKYKIKNKYVCPYITSDIFALDNLASPSQTEELLMQWLCAVQMIQSSSIIKLKKSNFIIERNSRGSISMLCCKYYKSRSHKEHTTPILSGSSIEAKAIDLYLKYFKKDSDKIFKLSLNNILTFQPINGNPYHVIYRLFSEKNISIQTELKKQYRLNKSTPIFENIYTILAHEGSKNYTRRITNPATGKKYKNYNDYLNNELKPLPYHALTLNTIKKTSVYAMSDKYRESDISNFNSHSSDTEKRHYRTNANPEWKNQRGRLFRMVSAELEQFTFKPNLHLVDDITAISLNRTKLITEENLSKSHH